MVQVSKFESSLSMAGWRGLIAHATTRQLRSRIKTWFAILFLFNFWEYHCNRINSKRHLQTIFQMSSTMQKVEQKLGMKSEKGKAHDEKKKAHEERRQKGEDVSDTSSSSESDSGRKYNEEERQRK